jgi:site-specific recombinase XerD
MDWWPYYLNELGARDVRPATVTTYHSNLKKFGAYIGGTSAAVVTSARVEAWRDHMLTTEGMRPGTINCRLRWLGTFYAWLVSEGVVTRSPTLAVAYLSARDASAPPVYDPPQVAALIAAARRKGSGRDVFAIVRDEALLSFMADTGVRASECAGILLENVNAAVTKGRYDRTVTFGFQTAKRLGRYLRERESHPFAWEAQLFLGRKGGLTYAGVYEIVRTAGRHAGIIGARPHLLRHTFAHSLKAEGVSDEVLMSLGGWRSPLVLARYGSSQRHARAVETYQRVGSPVDRGAGASRGGQRAFRQQSA